MASSEAGEVKALLILVVMLIAVGIFLLVVWRAWRQRQIEKGLKLPTETKVPVSQRICSKSPAEEGSAPVITVSSIQPKPFFGRQETTEEYDEGIEEGEEKEKDLGRLYFALRYETGSSTLIIKLLRGEDIPTQGQIKATYVDVNLIPLNSDTLQFSPHHTTLNITFKETYQFPLSPQNLSFQTIHFHICRYDMHSRRIDIGEVFLALAELVAQGIDITREVYLCRNLISCQTIHSQKRCLTDSDKSGSGSEQDIGGKSGKPARKKKPRELWDKLRSAVKDREFIVPSAMFWEPLFYQGGSDNGSPSEFQFASPFHKADHTEYFSLTETGESVEPFIDEGGEEFSISDSDFEISWDTPKGPRTPHFSFSSDLESTPLEINPAPEDYYKITPMMTPFKVEPLISWPVPQTFSPGQSRQSSSVTEITQQVETSPEAAIPRNYSTDFSPAKPKIRRTGSFSRTGAMTSLLSEQTKTKATFTKTRHKLPAKSKKKEMHFMAQLKFPFQRFRKKKDEAENVSAAEEKNVAKKAESETDSDQGSFISIKCKLQTNEGENAGQNTSVAGQPEHDQGDELARVASEIVQFTELSNREEMLNLPPREQGDGGVSEPVSPTREEPLSDVYVPTSEDEVARESSESPWKLRTGSKKARKKKAKLLESVKKLEFSHSHLYSRRTKKSPGSEKSQRISSSSDEF